MRTWPLRIKLTLWVVVVGGIALGVFGVLVGIALDRAQLTTLDKTLTQQSADFFESLADRRVAMDWKDDAEVRKLFSLVQNLYQIEVESPPGALVFRTRTLGNRGIPAGPLGAPRTLLVEGRETRILQAEKDGTLLRLASDMTPLREAKDALFHTYLILLPATLVLIAIGGAILSRKALRPIRDIAAAAARIDPRRGDDRLPSGGARDEVGRLTEVLNEMLARARQSFVQMERFSADASHELKTPLTIIRGEIESAMRDGGLSPAIQKTMSDLLDETGRLIHIVESLLLLSQADAGKLHIALLPLDLSALIADLAEDIVILAEPQKITVTTAIEPRVIIAGSAQFLRQIVLNLFDNAVKYNRPGGEIHANLALRGEDAILTLRNTGDGIPAADRGLVFDRFHRGDRSRDRRSGGQGLGLALAREIARAHDGDITLAEDEPGWTRFVLTLPARSTTQSGFFRISQATRDSAYTS